MEKNQISVFQLVILLYVCRSFNLFTAALHDVGASYGLVHLAAFPVAAVFQLLLMLPAYFLMRATGRGLGETAAYTMGRWGFWFPVLGVGYLLITTSLTVYSMADFLVNAAFSGANAVFFIVTLVLAAGYAATMGIEGISRAALILFVIFTLGLLLIFFGVAERMAPVNVRPFLDGDPVRSVLKGAWMITARSSPAFLFALLAPQVRGNGAGKGFVYYLLATLVLQEAVTFLISSVLGDLAASKAFPLFTLTTIARISVFQRMDAVHLGIWVAISFLRVSVSLWACRELLQSFVPGGKTAARRKWILPFLMIAVVCGAAAMTWNKQMLQKTLDLLSGGWPLAAVLFLSPLVMMVVGGIRKRLRKGVPYGTD